MDVEHNHCKCRLNEEWYVMYLESYNLINGHIQECSTRFGKPPIFISTFTSPYVCLFFIIFLCPQVLPDMSKLFVFNVFFHVTCEDLKMTSLSSYPHFFKFNILKREIIQGLMLILI